MNAPVTIKIDDATARKAELWDSLYEFDAHGREALTRAAYLGSLTFQNVALMLGNMERHFKRFSPDKAATLMAAALILRQEASLAGDVVCKIEDGGNLFLGEG